MTMLNDAGAKLESTVPVYDIAEVVAARLQTGDGRRETGG
jgi:hypothetical protein